MSAPTCKSCAATQQQGRRRQVCVYMLPEASGHAQLNPPLTHTSTPASVNAPVKGIDCAAQLIRHNLCKYWAVAARTSLQHKHNRRSSTAADTGQARAGTASATRSALSGVALACSPHARPAPGSHPCAGRAHHKHEEAVGDRCAGVGACRQALEDQPSERDATKHTDLCREDAPIVGHPASHAVADAAAHQRTLSSSERTPARAGKRGICTKGPVCVSSCGHRQ